ncbi:MAG: FAD-dependent 5-carboxymethylaminomethyl-2-thiouridine(34) oxidoreductase MnmC, partial [Leptospirales bacterium]
MVEPPGIRFEDGVPVSTLFDDVYFSRAGGLAETRAIFLEQNRLPERWQALRNDSGDPCPLFSIGELGFGTGLNFCATVESFRRHAPARARLRYFSCEQHPLKRADLARALAPFQVPERVGGAGGEAQTSSSSNLVREVESLLEIYPPGVPGVHVLPFPLDPRVQLILLYGDANEMFAGLADSRRYDREADIKQRSGIDAWYLDGFAPARNPDMWRPELFQSAARLSAPGATFATYTAAGAVRRNLNAAGFRVEKVPGFGRKREMLRGFLEPRGANSGETKSNQVRSAIVIGAGLAGTAAARALIARGFRVTLIEREDRVASGASGNPLGVAAPAATARPTPLSRLTRAGLYYLRATLAALHAGGETPLIAAGRGAILLAHTPELEQRFQTFAPSSQSRSLANQNAVPKDPAFARFLGVQEASEIAGTSVAHPGLYFPDAFCISPPRLCEALIAAARAETRVVTGDPVNYTSEKLKNPEEPLRVILNTEAIQLEPIPDGWRVLGGDRAAIAQASVAVLANGPDLTRFSQTAWMPLQALRGQTCSLPAGPGRPALKTALCYDGYVTPAAGSFGRSAAEPDAARPCFQIGATFEKWNQNRDVEPKQNRRLFERLCAVAPEFAKPDDHDAQPTEPEALNGRVAFRTASQDRFPLIGPAPDAESWAAADAEAGAEGLPGFAANLAGLYVFSALGSRGLVFAGIGAEILAALITGETQFVESDLVQALRP